MNILKNIVAIVLGIVIGGVVNFIIVMQGSLPEGVDMNNLAQNMHLLEAKHYILPILGHALGTFVGAFIAAFIAYNNKYKFAMIIAVFYLIGGIANIYTLHFPLIPAIIDLSVAYLPMGFLAWKIYSYFLNRNYTT